MTTVTLTVEQHVLKTVMDYVTKERDIMVAQGYDDYDIKDLTKFIDIVNRSLPNRPMTDELRTYLIDGNEPNDMVNWLWEKLSDTERNEVYDEMTRIID